VSEYIRYTERRALTRPFRPTDNDIECKQGDLEARNILFMGDGVEGYLAAILGNFN
jgi:hypothetical protein